VRTERANFRTVYFAFGFEAINNASDRALVMERVLDWLNPDLTDAGEEIPAAPMRLSQNVPNPFNPQTEIRFNLATDAKVRLAVYDVEGRLLRVLVDGRRAAGAHSEIWDGRDEQGRPLSSGLYFYSLQGEGRDLTRKMMLIK
jgi:hypothetical protein